MSDGVKKHSSGHIELVGQKNAPLEKKGDDDNDLTKQYQTEAHKWNEAQLEDVFHTNLTGDEIGLSDQQFKNAFKEYGFNKLTPKKQIHWFVKWFKCVFGGFFNILLWVGSLLSFGAYGGDPNKDPVNLYIGVVLAVVVMITGTFSYFQESKSDAIMEGFKNFLPQTVDVYRDFKRVQIEATDLVPGDVVELVMGDKLPADVRILSCSKDTQVDNSALTGESEPQERAPHFTHESPMETKNLAFFGTLIVKGRGRALVINTGDHTLMGRIAALADSTENEATPIAKEIKGFVIKISAIAITLGVVFGIVSGIKSGEAVASVIFVIGIIVANVPEGLLATVTVSLTLTAQRMALKAVLVKNLEAVETLGSTSVICSDKTGTLTMNIMTVSHVYYDLSEFECDTESPLDGDFDPKSVSFQKLIRCAVLCNNAKFKEDGSISGDASETALVKFSNPQYGNNIEEFRSVHPQKHAIPFNSANKWQISIHDRPDSEAAIIVLKGAPEKVLEYCDEYLLDGRAVPLTDEVRHTISQGVLNLGKKGERVLGFCHLELSPEEFPPDFEFDGDNRENVNFPFGRENEKGLVFIGLMSMIDPPRPGVPQAVHRCQTAGIKVIMVTGDHPITAKAIAHKVGIIQHKTKADLAEERRCDPSDILDSEARAVVVTGRELSDNLEEQSADHVRTFWNTVLGKESVVFARTSPQQKLLIVQACQERGGIVAVTGDGVNDSPALKKADIGVAMGKTGTDVAKDAADMILLDDNFASIVNGVEEGRIIFDNLKKSIAYTLSSNIPEIIPFLLFVILSIPLPLSTVLILLVDLGTDLAPAISLAHEGKEADIMRRPPRDPKSDNLVTWRLISFSYLQIGVIQALAGLYTYMVVLHDFGIHPFNLRGLDGNGLFSPTDPVKQLKGRYLYCYKNHDINCAYSPRADDPDLWAGDSDNPGELLDHRYPMFWTYRREALMYAQTSYFISIIVVQWADLLICKTRIKSIYDQGMKNGFMNYSLIFETCLGAVFCYVPGLNTVFGTKPLHFVHWLPGMPFSIIIFAYDELRKAWIRKHRHGWVERITYW